MSDCSYSFIFQTIFELLPQPIFLLKKKNLRIEFCNFETQNLLGKSNESLKGILLEDIFTEDPILIANILEIIKKNGVFLIKDKIKLKDSFFEINCITSQELDNNFFIVLNKVLKKNTISDGMNYLNEIFQFACSRGWRIYLGFRSQGKLGCFKRV